MEIFDISHNNQIKSDQETVIKVSKGPLMSTLLLEIVQSTSMVTLSKSLSQIIVLIIALSSLTIGTVYAQSSKPAVPDFTLKLENETLLLTIKNQPFDINNSNHYSFVYDVRVTNIDGNWRYFYNAEDGYPTQSNSSYTVFSYALKMTDYYRSNLTTLGGIVIPSNGEVPFQVRAMIGFRDRGVYSNGILPYVFKGETSDWSNNQTISIPTTGTSNPTPTVPELSWLMILPLFILVPSIAVMVRLRKTCKIIRHLLI